MANAKTTTAVKKTADAGAAKAATPAVAAAKVPTAAKSGKSAAATPKAPAAAKASSSAPKAAATPKTPKTPAKSVKAAPAPAPEPVEEVVAEAVDDPHFDGETDLVDKVEDATAEQESADVAALEKEFDTSLIPEDIAGDRKKVSDFLFVEVKKALKSNKQLQLEYTRSLSALEVRLSLADKLTGPDKPVKGKIQKEISRHRKALRTLGMNIETLEKEQDALYQGKEKRRGAFKGRFRTIGDFAAPASGGPKHFTKAALFSDVLMKFLASKNLGLPNEAEVKKMLKTGAASYSVISNIMTAYAHKNGLRVSAETHGEAGKKQYMVLTKEDAKQLEPLLSIIRDAGKGDLAKEGFLNYGNLNQISGVAIKKDLTPEDTEKLAKLAPLVDKVQSQLQEMKRAEKEAAKAAKKEESERKKAEKAAAKAAAKAAGAAEAEAEAEAEEDDAEEEEDEEVEGVEYEGEEEEEEAEE